MENSGLQMRILRIKQVQDRLGLSRSTIYDRMNAKSPRYDREFPKPLRLGASAIGWLEESVNEWIRNRIESSRGN